jgi:hypothetical protein
VLRADGHGTKIGQSPKPRGWRFEVAHGFRGHRRWGQTWRLDLGVSGFRAQLPGISELLAVAAKKMKGHSPATAANTPQLLGASPSDISHGRQVLLAHQLCLNPRTWTTWDVMGHELRPLETIDFLIVFMFFLMFHSAWAELGCPILTRTHPGTALTPRICLL